MKRICALMILFAFVSCGPTTDGNPNTDTTSMPIDTMQYQDTSNHVNTMHGTQPLDSTANSSSTGGTPY